MDWDGSDGEERAGEMPEMAAFGKRPQASVRMSGT